MVKKLNYSITIPLLEKIIFYINKNNLFFFYSNIYGLKKKIKKLLKKNGFSININLKKINSEKFFFLNLFLNTEGKSIFFFKKDLNQKNKFESEINNLKFKRKKLGLPVNGQRTRCNAKTAKYINLIKNK